MRVIPVLDIKNGIVVHAQKGQREKYEPIKSVLVDTADPVRVVEAFRRKLGLSEIYIADLDAIEKKGNNYPLIQEIATQKGIKLMVDAGANNVEMVEQLLKLGVDKIIIGSETLAEIRQLTEILKTYANRIIFSIDIKDDKIITLCYELKTKQITEIIAELLSLGVKEFIYLPLSNVGTGQGLEVNHLKGLLPLKSQMKMIVGGGIKDNNNLLVLRKLGFDGALTATALHSGRITVGDLA